MSDARLLYVWRNDPEAIRASVSTEPIGWAEHEAWLSKTLASTDHLIRVVEEEGTPVAAVRADRQPTGWKLSWMVAKEARGRRIGRRMLKLFVADLDGRLFALVRRDNIASAKIAAAAGLVRTDSEATGDFECWVRD